MSLLPKSFRLRFSLFSLLLVVTACCLFLGWWTNSTQRQKHAVAWVKEQGGIAYYDWQVNDDGEVNNFLELESNWLRDLLGVDFFHKVTGATIHNANTSELSPVANLIHLKGKKGDKSALSQSSFCLEDHDVVGDDFQHDLTALRPVASRS